MGFSVKLAPGVRVRVSSHGVRAGIGPRIARVHAGTGRTGFSSGLGPFSVYGAVGGKRRRKSGGRSSGRPSGAALERQAAAARRAQAGADKAREAQRLAAIFQEIISLHQRDFPPVERPVAPMPELPDPNAVRERHEKPPGGQNRRRLPTGDAHLPGPRHRRRRAATDRIHQVPRTEADCRRRRGFGQVTMITAAVPERENYLNHSYGIKSWLLTKDHKRIGLLYLFTVTLFFFLGGAFATLIRIELLTPQGNFVSSETYNKLFTMHGVAMIFFFLIPAIPATLGNFFLPMMIGARDLAFPRVNLLSWYLLVVGGLFSLFAMLAGGVDTGWTFYTPYSTTYSNSWVIATALGIFISGFSSILTGLNFIVTVHRMRAPGMTWMRMPLF